MSCNNPEGTVRTTLNGINLWAKQCEHVKEYFVALGVPVGAECDPLERPGLAHFLEHTAYRGGERFADAFSMMEYLSMYGEMPRGYTRRQHTLFEVNLPPELILRGMEVLSALVFDQSYRSIDLEREIIRQERWDKLCSMKFISEDALSAAATNHPNWQHLGIGTDESLQRITADDLRGFHETWYKPGYTHGVIIGPQPEVAMLDMFEQALSWIPKRNEDEIQLPEPASIEGNTSSIRNWSEWGASFNNAVLSYSIELPQNPETIRLATMAAYILDDMHSLLYHVIRQREGLIYELKVGVEHNRGFNEFYFLTSAQPTRLPRIRELFEQVIKNVDHIRHAFPAIHQAILHNLVNNQTPIDNQGRIKLHAMLKQREIPPHDFEIEAVSKLTADDIIAFAQHYLTPDRWRIIEIVP